MYSIEVPVEDTEMEYELSISNPAYIITSDITSVKISKEASSEVTADITIMKLSTKTVSGAITGFADDYDVSELGIIFSTDEDTEYDEHIWLSLKNAKVLTQQLADVIKELDSENADEYQSNADAYIKQLSDLDKEYETVISSSRLDTVVFGDRFPFRYLVDDYNLDYYAAFAGCSAETEASFKTVTFLAGKVDEIGTKVILAIDGSDEKIANTIKDNTKDKNQEILVLDSMQSAKTTESDDYNYINVMVKNLTVLKQALA